VAYIKMKKLAFRFFLFALPLLLLILMDLVLGYYEETASIRESSRMFRSEAIPLPLMTRSLTPHTNNRYHLGLRDDPHFRGDINAPRLFRTSDRRKF
jgi:hypothetical protein